MMAGLAPLREKVLSEFEEKGGSIVAGLDEDFDKVCLATASSSSSSSSSSTSSSSHECTFTCRGRTPNSHQIYAHIYQKCTMTQTRRSILNHKEGPIDCSDAQPLVQADPEEEWESEDYNATLKSIAENIAAQEGMPKTRLPTMEELENKGTLEAEWDGDENGTMFHKHHFGAYWVRRLRTNDVLESIYVVSGFPFLPSSLPPFLPPSSLLQLHGGVRAARRGCRSQQYRVLNPKPQTPNL